MKKIITGVLVTSALLSSYAIQAADSSHKSDPRTLTAGISQNTTQQNNDSYGIDIPENWTSFSKGVTAGNSGVFYNYLQNKEQTEAVALMKYKGSVNPEDLLMNLLFQAKQEKWNIIDRGTMKLTGYNAVRISHKSVNNGTEVIETIYIIERANTGYMITFVGPSGNYSLKAYDNMISTFSG